MLNALNEWKPEEICSLLSEKKIYNTQFQKCLEPHVLTHSRPDYLMLGSVSCYLDFKRTACTISLRI
jgi:hypothetical protein